MIAERYTPLVRIGTHARPGFLLLEVMLGIVLFSLFLSAIGFTLLYGQEGTIMSGDRVRATHLTQRALEAARSIRDTTFSGLTAGQHGVWINGAGQWAFTGSAVTFSGGYVTQLTVTPLASDWIGLTAETRWKHGYGRSGSVILSTQLTDWRSTIPVGNWASLTLQGTYTAAGTPLFNHVDLSGDYAFITSEVSDGGVGLYIIDLSNLSSPQRVAASFSLGSAGYAVRVRGQRLYVLTADANAELKVYDIASPTVFSAADLVTSYNIPGSGRGRSMVVAGNSLVVGVTESATSGHDELYTFDISNSGSVVLQDSLDRSASFWSVALSGTSALLASSDDGAELLLADIETPANLSFPANQGYNMTNSQDALTVAVSGTAAVLGRANGSSIDEMALFDLEGGGGFPAPPPGPWYHEVGGSVNGVAMDPAGCYAFLASDFSNKELQIVRIRSSALPEASSYNATSGAGRGLHYDAERDRLLLLTNTALHIFQPGSGTCS